jgi:hypothetical protein
VVRSWSVVSPGSNGSLVIAMWRCTTWAGLARSAISRVVVEPWQLAKVQQAADLHGCTRFVVMQDL